MRNPTSLRSSLLLATATLAACNLVSGADDISVEDEPLLPPGEATSTGTVGAGSGAGSVSMASVGQGPSAGGAGGTSSAGGAPGSGGDPITTSAASTTAASTTAASTTTTTTTTGGNTDPYASARQVCVDTINMLRATNNKPPLATWTAGESCADQQANADQMANDPHGAFGMCGESGQNECLGQGPSGVASCLQGMWDERLLPGCSGCDACSGSYNPNCPNCDFYGMQTGDVCGHYVNMNAEYFTEVACGFSDQGGWVVINFR